MVKRGLFILTLYCFVQSSLRLDSEIHSYYDRPSEHIFLSPRTIYMAFTPILKNLNFTKQTNKLPKQCHFWITVKILYT